MLGEYLGAGASTTKLLLHLNGNSTDSSGNGNNGTDTNITYSLANGKFGQGAGFNGSSSGISTTLTGASVFTVSLWINTTTTTGGYIFNRNAAADNANYGLTFASNKLSLGSFSGSTGLNVNGNTTITNGVWYQVVCVVNGASSILYLNGSVDGTGALQTHTSGTNFRLGNTGHSTQYYSGKIDEVIVEDRIWTASEIKKYYTYSKGRF